MNPNLLRFRGHGGPTLYDLCGLPHDWVTTWPVSQLPPAWTTTDLNSMDFSVFYTLQIPPKQIVKVRKSWGNTGDTSSFFWEFHGIYMNLWVLFGGSAGMKGLVLWQLDNHWPKGTLQHQPTDTVLVHFYQPTGWWWVIPIMMAGCWE